MDGLYEVRGDASLLMLMDTLFGRALDEAVSAPQDQRRPGPLSLRGSRWLTVAFLPWIVLWFTPLLGLGVPAAVRIAFLVAVILTAYHAVFSRPAWFETGSVLLLGIAAAWSLLPAGRVGLAGWGGSADSLALGIIWLSSLLGRAYPLTADYSSWDHAPALWENGTFLHVNRVLTFLWGAVFVTMGVLAVAALRWPAAAGALGPAGWLLLVPAIVATATLPRRASQLRIKDLDGWNGRLRVAAWVGIAIAVGVALAAGAIAGAPAVASL